MIDELRLEATEEWAKYDLAQNVGETVISLCADHRELTEQVAALTAERDSEARWAQYYCEVMVAAHKVIIDMVRYYDVDLGEVPFGNDATRVLNEIAMKE